MATAKVSTHTITKAIEIACKSHYGQYDIANQPYILHPLHVAAHVNTESEKIVALLHDVVEDTSTTIKELSEYFAPNIIDAIRLLTKKPNQEYMDYIKAIAPNQLARIVKIADLEHNMDIRRLEKIGDDDLVRLAKYHKAWRYLVDYEKKQN